MKSATRDGSQRAKVLSCASNAKQKVYLMLCCMMRILFHYMYEKILLNLLNCV